LIVNACAVLHNISIQWKLPEDFYLDEIDIDHNHVNQERFNDVQNIPVTDHNVREQIIRIYFNNN